MGTEHRLDAARADVARLEKDLALERAKCDCHSEERRAAERGLREARDRLRDLENRALAKLGTHA